jgi:hypothetical protein
MNMNKTFLTVGLASFLTLSGFTSKADLIVNGNFETGTLAGWTEADQAGGSGSWYISSPGANTPVSGYATANNPSGGSYYAVSDQTGPGTHVLIQSFTLASAETLTLSFQMFVNSQDGSYDTGLLDYNVNPNEFGLADLLTGTATPFSTAPADVLQTFYSGNDPQANNPNPYTTYTYTLSLAAGTYQLRFGEVDNQSFFQMGVDNVSLTPVVPEPTTIIAGALLLLPFGMSTVRMLRKTALHNH